MLLSRQLDRYRQTIAARGAALTLGGDGGSHVFPRMQWAVRDVTADVAVAHVHCAGVIIVWHEGLQALALSGDGVEKLSMRMHLSHGSPIRIARAVVTTPPKPLTAIAQIGIRPSIEPNAIPNVPAIIQPVIMIVFSRFRPLSKLVSRVPP
jgi:hypothetical protein